MKYRNQSIATLAVILFISMAVIKGCSTTGVQRSEKATTTMQTVDSDIQLILVQLDITASSLNELTKSGQPDVKKAFDLFTDNSSKIVKMEKEFSKHADEMKSRGKEYFSEWQKDGSKYQNQQIQELSEQRRSELSEIYSAIAFNSIGVKEAFKTYVSDIMEIQNFLSNDLTPKGIDAIASTSQNVIRDGDNLKTSIKNVQTAIERAKSEMALSGK